MTENLQKLRIFVAAPSDVATERAKVETVATSLKPIADYLGLTLEVVDWRAVVPDAGRPQQVIFDQLKPTSWDIFVGILWHRFGTPPGAKDPQTQKEYLSGTEEEFRVAYRLWKEYGKPRIIVYRCTRAIPLDADFAQAQRVKDFFKEIQDPHGEFRVLTQSFDTPESFEKLALDNLQKLLIEYGNAHGKGGVTPPLLAPKIPNNLPRRAAFFGRAKEMNLVMRALSPADRTWGVLIDGIGGIGKTALAVEAAHRAQDAGAFDAFVWVTAKQTILAPSGIREQTPVARTLDDFLNETARVLGQIGIPKLSSDEKRRALLDALRATRALLIYDNLETLSKEEQEAMADFLRELPPACKAIITSRRRGGEGAVWLRLEKLDWDAARGIIENEMARDAGLATKLRRAESRWQELYDETNGSPLALLHTLGLMRVRATLTFDGALEMLRGNRDADLQKFIFQEARKELTENDEIALGALSFFVPSATFEAWMQVAGITRNALETTIDRLSALSLVDVLAGEERYALHPLTRAFVRNELLGDANVVCSGIETRFALYLESRWAEEYRKSIEVAVLVVIRDLASQGQASEERLRGMARRTLALIEPGMSIMELYQRGVQLDEGYPELGPVVEKIRKGTILAARNVPGTSRTAWLREGDPYTLEFLGNRARSQQEYDLAEIYYREAFAIEQIFNDKGGQAQCQSNLGWLALDRKQYPNAYKCFEQELALAQEIGRQDLIADAQYGLARMHQAEGRADLALPLAQEALKIYERLQHKDLAEVRELVERLKGKV